MDIGASSGPSQKDDRYSSRTALERLNLVYAVLRHYVNFFQPTMKLGAKTRHGAKVHKDIRRGQDTLPKAAKRPLGEPVEAGGVLRLPPHPQS